MNWLWFQSAVVHLSLVWLFVRIWQIKWLQCLVVLYQPPPSLIFTLAQVILICWVFGMDNFLKCLKEMEVKISTTAEWYLIIYGKFILPLVLLALLVSNAYANLKNLIGGDKMQILQLILTISSISLFPIMALWEFVKKCRRHD